MWASLKYSNSLKTDGPICHHGAAWETVKRPTKFLPSLSRTFLSPPSLCARESELSGSSGKGPQWRLLFVWRYVKQCCVYADLSQHEDQSPALNAVVDDSLNKLSSGHIDVLLNRIAPRGIKAWSHLQRSCVSQRLFIIYESMENAKHWVVDFAMEAGSWPL